MKLTIDNAVTVLECSRPYASSGCGASDEEIDEAMIMGLKALEQTQWITVSERLPNKNQWVLVTTEDYQKPAEVMCYQGIRIGQHNVGNGWEEYEYPSWTSGHGDIQSSHPKAWMSLPEPYKEG